MHKQLISVVVLLLALSFAPFVLSKEFKAKVIGIADGDTIKVLKDGVEYKIRLRGIDCPEKSQPFGNKAKLFTSQLAFNKEVEVIEAGKDRYDRLIADVILPDHTSLSEDIVRAGYAWWYREYAPKDHTLAYAEADAKLEGVGIWSSRIAQAPWEYRHEQRMNRTKQYEAVKAPQTTVARTQEER
jgi:endonuclease YncB( thermonuclease family)